MVVNRSAPPGTVVPSLIYEDVAAAIDWLCTTFRLTERLRAARPDGTVGHAQISIGEGSVTLGEARVGQGFASPDTAVFRPPRREEVSMTISVSVEDVDQHFEHVRGSGARILQPPETYPYGERQYTVEDLAGYRWTFTQSIADVAPGEWGATTRDG
jgi:uncharacterized glyoxalase superfamily protein PhnB